MGRSWWGGTVPWWVRWGSSRDLMTATAAAVTVASVGTTVGGWGEGEANGCGSAGSTGNL